MSVQDLINILLEIEDKTLPVYSLTNTAQEIKPSDISVQFVKTENPIYRRKQLRLLDLLNQQRLSDTIMVEDLDADFEDLHKTDPVFWKNALTIKPLYLIPR